MSDEEEHSESEFYYPDELEFQDNGELTGTNNKIETFVKEQKSENTTKKTVSDMKTFQRYLSSISKGDEEILHLPADVLDHLLAKFFKDIRKINGDEYEPDTLSGFQRSIQRFLSDGKSPFNILVQKEFQMSRKVLAAKRKSLVQKAGKGNRPNATRAVPMYPNFVCQN